MHSGKALLTLTQLLLFTAVGLIQPAFASINAEIVSLSGKGARKNPDTRWQAAKVNDQVIPGGYVRTFAASQMGVLLAGRTQIRLNQNSQLQIKTSSDTEAWQKTNLNLTKGRAWSNARPVKTDRAIPSEPAITMETPSATLSIRGTVWEVEVAPDGKTQLVVLHGLVEMANEHGKVQVSKGEAAIAEVGKAPVKIFLSNPASRVQWVNSWRPDPKRWQDDAGIGKYKEIVNSIENGEYAYAIEKLKTQKDEIAAVLRADLLIYQGENANAIELLSPHAKSGRGNPFAIALTGYALFHNDQITDLEKLLVTGLSHHPNHIELLLLAGKYAIFQGDATQAKTIYQKAINLYPENTHAWYGLGLIESEKENLKDARLALGTAIQHAVDFTAPESELATLESKAGNFDVAEDLFNDVINKQPEDYVALTGKGLLLLKLGKSEKALDTFMKAGVIEPGYARAWLYSGVAFYQLGEFDRALEAFRRASELDNKDPLPHLIQSQYHTDVLEYGAAIRSSQDAQIRMPYLKSLNQIENDQKGSANLGNALADFGLEAWANYYATSSFSPYWAGSHLFLADRYTGFFNKNSELFKGYLTDPTVFGASNRFSSLMPRPGHYGRLDLGLESTTWQQALTTLTLNGLALDPAPIAYFISGDLATTESKDDDSDGDGNNITIGLGSKLNERWGIFAFGTETNVDADLETTNYPDGNIDVSDTQVAIGTSYKIGPQNQLWLKMGSGDQENRLWGEAIVLNTQAYLDFDSNIDQEDIQFRHTFTNQHNIELTWGLEYSSQEKPAEMQVQIPGFLIDFNQQHDLDSMDAYLSIRGKPGNKLTIQGDLFWQDADISQTAKVLVNGITTTNPRIDRDYNEFNPRFGLGYQVGQNQSIRLIGQSWRRPASVNTLSQVDTLGIPVNDWLVSAGGKYHRGRLQYDGEINKETFLRIFFDHEKIDNISFASTAVVPDLTLDELQRLQNQLDVFEPEDPYEDIPLFDEGEVDSVGLTFNHLITSKQTLALELTYYNDKQTGTNPGLKIPYIPDFKGRIASHWTLPHRWVLGADATYRNRRYEDQGNTIPIDSGWNFGFIAHWESLDKKLNFQASVRNILSSSDAAEDADANLAARLSYLF